VFSYLCPYYSYPLLATHSPPPPQQQQQQY
jgi:hypothetical protein